MSRSSTEGEKQTEQPVFYVQAVFHIDGNTFNLLNGIGAVLTPKTFNDGEQIVEVLPSVASIDKSNEIVALVSWIVQPPVTWDDRLPTECDLERVQKF